ncbi:MAG: hypothetical protein ACT4OO_12910 [Nitrospiraceae bacterium]
MVRETKTSVWIIILALAFAVGVTVLDVMPWFQGWSWHGLYVIPVIWIALWSSAEDVFLLTTVASVVTVLAFLPLFDSIGSKDSASIGDRTMVVVVVWLTVLLSALRKRAQRTYKWINLASRRR